MSKRCPDCGTVNEDSRIYCAACGEPLDADLRLIKDLEAQKKKVSVQEAAPAPDPEPAPRRKTADDDDYTVGKLSKEKKSSPMPFIILGIILVVVGALIVYYAL